jgi:hypothetical protein
MMLNIGDEMYVKYRHWWDDLEKGKKKFPDLQKIVVKGTVVSIDFNREVAVVCFPGKYRT